jgi:hypothetical protein
MLEALYSFATFVAMLNIPLQQFIYSGVGLEHPNIREA